MSAVNPISSNDPGRTIANMRLYQEVIAQASRERPIPRALAQTRNAGQNKTPPPEVNANGGVRKELYNFKWRFPPSSPLEPTPPASPSQSSEKTDSLAPLAALGRSEERLGNLQRVRLFDKESIFERLHTIPHRKVLVSPDGAEDSAYLTVKNSITDDTLWHLPVREAQDILLMATPLSGLHYDSQV